MRHPAFFAILLLCCTAVAQEWKPATPVASAPAASADLDWDTELNLFNRFYGQASYQGALQHAQNMIDIATRRKLDARSLAAGEWAMGMVLFHQRQFKEAESHMRCSLELRESVLPATHFRVLQSVSGLARILVVEEKYDDAAPLLQRSIAAYSAMNERSGEQECAYGMDMQNLGRINLLRQNYDKAEGLLTHAARSFGQVGIGCGELHEVYRNLANVYWMQNRKDKAEEVYKVAVQEFTPDAGEPTDYHYGVYSLSLASLYSSQKRFDEADPLYKSALSAAEHISTAEGAEAHTGLLADILHSYKEMLVAANRNADALAVEQRLRALTDVNAANSANPELQLRTLMMEFASAAQEQRFEEAEKNLRRAVDVARGMGRQGIDLQLQLGWFLESRGRSADAVRTLESAFSDAQRNFPSDPQVQGFACNAIAQFYQVHYNEPAAEPSFKRCVALWRKYPDRNDLAFASTLRNFGQYYMLKGEYASAEPYLLESLAVEERVRGPESFPITTALDALGNVYMHLGKWEKAEPYYRRQLALDEKQFGTNHQVLGAPLMNLENIMRNTGRMKEAEELQARRTHLENPAGPQAK